MPRVIDGVKLTDSQLAALDRCIAEVKGVKSAFAVCTESFKRAHRIVGAGPNRRWVPKKGSTAKA
jgi:hypothetical protein